MEIFDSCDGVTIDLDVDYTETMYDIREGSEIQIGTYSATTDTQYSHCPTIQFVIEDSVFDITNVFSLDDGDIKVDSTYPSDVETYNLKIIAEIE